MNLDVIKEWITTRVTEVLGIEDELAVLTVGNYLDVQVCVDEYGAFRVMYLHYIDVSIRSFSFILCAVSLYVCYDAVS